MEKSFFLQERLVKAAHEERQRIARLDKTRTKRPTVAECYPQDADNAHDEQGLHHDTQNILPAHQSAIEKGDAGNAH